MHLDRSHVVYRFLLVPAASHDELEPGELQKVQKFIDGLKRKRPAKPSTPSAASTSTSSVGRAMLPSSDVVSASLVRLFQIERAVQNAVQPLVQQVTALQKQVSKFKHLLSDDDTE